MVVFAGEGFSVAMRETAPEQYAVDARVKLKGWLSVNVGTGLEKDEAVKVAAEEVCKRAK